MSANVVNCYWLAHKLLLNDSIVFLLMVLMHRLHITTDFHTNVHHNMKTFPQHSCLGICFMLQKMRSDTC